jgi:hypothetical protein
MTRTTGDRCDGEVSVPALNVQNRQGQFTCRRSPAPGYESCKLPIRCAKFPLIVTSFPQNEIAKATSISAGRE